MIGMNVKEKDENTVVFQVRGDIAGMDSERFSKMMEELTKGKKPEIVVDMRFVRFIDSAGLGVLTYNHMALKSKKRKLVCVVSPGSFVSSLFEKTKLDKALHVEQAAGGGE